MRAHTCKSVWGRMAFSHPEAFLDRPGHWMFQPGPPYLTEPDRPHLRELVRTDVILVPGACWGGAELQSVDQIPWIRGNPRDPGMESFFRV